MAPLSTVLACCYCKYPVSASAESEIFCFITPRFLSSALEHGSTRSFEAFIDLDVVYPARVQRPTRQCLSRNCRPMRGLRVFVAPPLFRAPIAAGLYCAPPKTSAITMGKTSNGSCSEGSGEGLAPLSANDFRIYNRMSEQMNGFVSVQSLQVPLMNRHR